MSGRFVYGLMAVGIIIGMIVAPIIDQSSDIFIAKIIKGFFGGALASLPVSFLIGLIAAALGIKPDDE